MSEKKPNQKRHKKAAPPVALTPEQQAELKAAQEKVAAERKAEQERLQKWEASVPKMSLPQLRGEIRRVIRKEHVKVGKDQYEPQAGLTIAFATVFQTVLDSTESTNPGRGKLSAYPR